MVSNRISLAALALFLPAVVAGAQNVAPIRPPAAPLIVRNPYVSVWQPATRIAGHWSAFWTGATKAISGIAVIDGKPYRFLGDAMLPADSGVAALPSMHQRSLDVTPTSTRYRLTGGGVEIDLDFLSPVFSADLRRQSIPLGYMTATVHSTDSGTHTAVLTFDISGEWASGNASEPIVWARHTITTAGSKVLAYTISAATQKPLTEQSDYAGWGSAVFATKDTTGLTSQVGPDSTVRVLAAEGKPLDGSVDSDMPRPLNERWPVFAYQARYAQVGTAATKRLVFALGFERTPAVSYLGKPLQPLWKSYWPTWQAMTSFFLSDYAYESRYCSAVDNRIVADAERVGGPQYAAICTIAFRQAFGATELVGTKANPWMFMKEISSDGNVSTVDVEYPAYPVFEYANPDLLRLLLRPLLAYAETGGWPKPFAEHDIGSSYPNASGHNDGREEDMPVEESANMLIMFDSALSHMPPAQAREYSLKHYAILKQWAAYEVVNGLDPALQNQTDDFTGFIKSSANLALKAILGVGAMGQIAQHAGNTADAAYFTGEAHKLIAGWVKLATSTTGPHLVLAYGQPDTWSLKYNAFPDKALRLHLIPRSVLAMDSAWYLKQEKPFGIPLDLRHTYTKTDWEMWTAAATDNPMVRARIINAIYRFANTSNFRGAFTDWYDTVSGQQVGFVARPVIGGLFSLLVRDHVTARLATIK